MRLLCGGVLGVLRFAQDDRLCGSGIDPNCNFSFGIRAQGFAGTDEMRPSLHEPS
jgi:hypothetical protein